MNALTKKKFIYMGPGNMGLDTNFTRKWCGRISCQESDMPSRTHGRTTNVVRRIDRFPFETYRAISAPFLVENQPTLNFSGANLLSTRASFAPCFLLLRIK